MEPNMVNYMETGVLLRAGLRAFQVSVSPNVKNWIYALNSKPQTLNPKHP